MDRTVASEQGGAGVASAVAAGGIYPPGVTNANWFGLFNTLSWQITLGAPAVLYAKSQGASSTLLGVIASLTPLLALMQLTATHLLPKYGYRRFVLMGWGARTVVIFAMAGVPLLSFASAGVRLWLLVGLLFAFNLLRGFAAGAWWPWISEIVPDALRGRFLSRDQVFSQVGAMASLSVAAVMLSGRAVRPWQFSLVFLISAIAQAVSLVFLNRVPEVTAPDKVKQSGAHVPWGHMVRWRPFFRLLVFNLMYQAFFGGLSVFTVSFMKGRAGFSESLILTLTTISVVGALATVTWVGKVVDREGSLPVLRVCIGAYLLILGGWWAVAGGVVRQDSVPVVAVLQLLTGVAGANYTVANNRLSMGTIPLMGRNHFFALLSVVTNLSLGLVPIVWGGVLDLIGDYRLAWDWVEWNRYSIYFAAVFGVAGATLGYSAWVREGAAREG